MMGDGGMQLADSWGETRAAQYVMSCRHISPPTSERKNLSFRPKKERRMMMISKWSPMDWMDGRKSKNITPCQILRVVVVVCAQRPDRKQNKCTREAILNRAISAAAVFPGSTTMQLHVLLLSIVPLALATSATIWLRAGMERECGRGEVVHTN